MKRGIWYTIVILSVKISLWAMGLQEFLIKSVVFLKIYFSKNLVVVSGINCFGWSKFA